MTKSLPAKGGFFPPRAPLKGADSPYQGGNVPKGQKG